MTLKFKILTLFPNAFTDLMGLIQTAREHNLLKVEAVNLRDFGVGIHKKVDDQVYGGSDGMLLSPHVLATAVNTIKSIEGFQDAKVYALSPKGTLWSQQQAEAWSQDLSPKILICGRYAGFDQRFLKHYCDGEISIGDYILNGGEVPALAIIESIARLIPAVLNNNLSRKEDSFSGDNHLLEAPHYTRPRTWENLEVPEVLLSGHHENINTWQMATRLTETLLRRPSLLLPEDFLSLKKYLGDPKIRLNLEVIYTSEELGRILTQVGL